MFSNIIWYLGLFQVSKFFITLVWEIIKELIPLANTLDKYNKDRKRYAVITGGTDGIGLGFVEVLAEEGWNICIISRNEKKIKEKIEEVKSRLASKQKKEVEWKYVVANFEKGNDVGFIDTIFTELSCLDIGILVNNVGTSDIDFFENFSTTQIINIITVNCTSMATLTAKLLPLFKKSSTAIINLSSFLGEVPAPYSTLYSATKAFNAFFSESLSMEKTIENVDILSVKPMFVESPLSKQKKGFTVPDRRQCARACLKELRWVKGGQYETYGYFIHRIGGVFAGVIPKWIKRLLAKYASYEMMVDYKRKV